MLKQEKECIDWAKKAIELRKKLKGKLHKVSDVTLSLVCNLSIKVYSEDCVN